MITGVMPGYAFYALLGVLLDECAGYSPVSCHAQMNIGTKTCTPSAPIF